MIDRAEVEATVVGGDLIESYPEDERGESCLLLGKGPIHVVCAPKADGLVVITVYRPDPQRWSADFRARRQS